MTEAASSIWTIEQVILTVVMVVCCAVLGAALRGGRIKPDGDATGYQRPSKAARWVLLAAFSFVAAFLVWRGNDPLGVRMDSYSDANVLVSGRQYARDGLLSHYGAPQHQVTSETNPPDPFYFYTKYPSASNLINGALQRSGVRSHRVLRLPAAIGSLLGLALWYGVFCRYIESSMAALGTIILGSSFLFLAYADSLHFHAYGFAAIAAATYCFVRAEVSSETRRGQWLALCGVLLFLASLFTWEYHLWFVTFVILHVTLLPSPRKRRYLTLLLIPFALAAGLSSIQRRLAEPALAQAADAPARQGEGLLDVIYRRTIGFESSLDTPAGLALPGYPAHMLLRVYSFYGIPAIGLLAMIILAARAMPRGGRLLICLSAAGAMWWCVMMQHSSVHPHVMRHFLPAYALVLAMTGALCWQVLRNRDAGWRPRGAAALLATTLIYAHAEGAWCNVRLHTRPDFVDSRGRNDAGEALAIQSAAMARLIPAGGVVLTNMQRLPMMRACMERPVYFAAAFKLPKDDPERSRWVLELAFNHLRELYAEKLPPLYYAYRVTHATLDEAFARNHQFRFLLRGSTDSGDTAWSKGRQALDEAMSLGSSGKSFCPIVGVVDRFILFDMTPAIPSLRSEFGGAGYPTREHFGPIP